MNQHKVRILVYIAAITLYLLIIALWSYRFPVSYKMTTGIDPNLITHDFTHEERQGTEKAYNIRQAMSSVFLYSSIIIAISSYVALRVDWLKPRLLLRSTFIVSTIIATILVLVNGIHFIPGPPIR